MWLFGKENHEQKLLSLAQQVQDAQVSLARAQLLNRRAQSAALLYPILAYLCYICWVVFFITNESRYIHYLALAAAPFGIYLEKKAVGAVFSWFERSKGKKLEKLKTSREKVVKEYKSKVKYDEIKRVLEIVEPEAKIASSKTQNQNTKSRKPVELVPPNQPSQVQGPQGPQGPPVNVQQAYKQTWMDRVLDVVLGPNEQSPNMRRALICPRCYAHNGLANFGEDPQYVMYVCPVCGNKNGFEESVEKKDAKPEMVQLKGEINEDKDDVNEMN